MRIHMALPRAAKALVIHCVVVQTWSRSAHCLDRGLDMPRSLLAMITGFSCITF
jgi:hypothetical protein